MSGLAMISPTGNIASTRSTDTPQAIQKPIKTLPWQMQSESPDMGKAALRSKMNSFFNLPSQQDRIKAHSRFLLENMAWIVGLDKAEKASVISELRDFFQAYKSLATQVIKAVSGKLSPEDLDQLFGRQLQAKVMHNQGKTSFHLEAIRASQLQVKTINTAISYRPREHRYIAGNGLKEVAVPGDGNCLFHSCRHNKTVASAFESVSALRKAVANEMTTTKRANTIKAVMNQSAEKVAKETEKLTVWAGPIGDVIATVTPSYLSESLAIPVLVLNTRNNTTTLYVDGADIHLGNTSKQSLADMGLDLSTTLAIIYNGSNHYSAADMAESQNRLESETQVAPAA